MSDEERTVEPIARAAYDAVQEAAAVDEDLNGAVLLGCYVVAEWAAQDGETYISQHSLGPDEEPLANWRSLGYLTWAQQTLTPQPMWMRCDHDEDEDDD